MNKAFTVRRGLTAHEMMRSSQLMSRYIHYAVTEKKENIWIAQREGRAKDSSDHTQDAVLKMLAMGGELRELNICPLTISYEFDPCDYLKAQEFQQKVSSAIRDASTTTAARPSTSGFQSSTDCLVMSTSSSSASASTRRFILATAYIPATTLP